MPRSNVTLRKLAGHGLGLASGVRPSLPVMGQQVTPERADIDMSITDPKKTAAAPSGGDGATT